MAAMKTSAGRLYMLFDACIPENDKIKKRLNIYKIVESNEYNELKNYTPFSEQFEQTFSIDKLALYDTDKLREVVEVIPMIIPLVEKIENSTKYGNGLELTDKDIPDFTSVKSVNELMDKMIVDYTILNLTNITKDNFMAIFSDSTIKDPAQVSDVISAKDLDNLAEAMKSKCKDSFYCFSPKGIEAMKNTYSDIISEISVKTNKAKRGQKLLKLAKYMFMVGIFIILTLVNGHDLLTTTNADALSLFTIVFLILYFFIG